jgi:endogenous inhibitor of DNA gyrase (YacG/DUF329 family)
MTTPPKSILVKCPQCQRVYIDWHTPAVGVPGAQAEGPSTVCSKCGHRSQMRHLSEIQGIFQK